MASATGLLHDHLGSTAITANASGARVTELRYYAYGGTRYDAGGQLTGHRYTGQRIEAGTGLYDYGARDGTIRPSAGSWPRTPSSRSRVTPRR